MDNLNNTNTTPKQKESVWELVKFALIAIIIILPIRIFIAQPFVVSGESMHPTFADGNYLIIDEISYRFKEPQRDDVIVFRYPNDTKKFFLKRIIGLPHDTVSINGSIVTITNDSYKDKIILDEPYVENHSDNILSATLGDDEYFLMGDNRSASYDSRAWGPVKKDLIIGRAFLRLLPINKINIYPGDYKQL
ncbi:MAG: signal peptidase I [bacterium]|nr:signal peptidase I [bacterium]